MSGSAADHLFDGVNWVQIPAPPDHSEVPYATHEGILRFANLNIRVYQLSTGQRVLDGRDIDALLLGGMADDR